MSKIIGFLNSQNGRRIISVSALVLWMGIIFLFSHQESGGSWQLSTPIQDAVFESTLGKNEYETVKERNFARVKIGHGVRSAAHFLLFAVLGVLSLTALMTFKMKMWQNVLLAAVWGWLYAVIDEIHQIFVPGRTFQWQDIGVDWLGVVFGVGLTFGVVMLVKIKRKKKNVENS